MAAFAYTAIDDKGQQTFGTVAADNRGAALDQVCRLGLHPVRVEEREGRAEPVKAAPVATGGRVSRADVETFTRGLSNLLAAGVPLSRGLQILSREAARPAAKAQWAAVYEDVVGGMPLAEAMAKCPRSFPPIYVAMVRAGETGGFIDVVLSQIADFQSRDQELKGRVKAALIYPCVLAFIACGVLIFLMTFFIPRFSKIFAEFGSALPIMTRVVVGASQWITSYAPVFVGVLVFVFLIGRRALASESGRRAAEWLMFKTPGLGGIVSMFAVVRFCRMLGTLLGSGVPLVSALRVAREAIGHQTLQDAVGKAIEEVQRGASLSRSLAACPQLFTASISEMVSVAEESGRLDKELVRLATSYEVLLDRRLRMLVSLVEPALLFIMAAFVGTIVISMLLPVFTLQELIK
ncbi:MAG: type II secretion system F family protein [Candidatus Brocadiia bacterium]|jgi:type II secretory pathway component PulF